MALNIKNRETCELVEELAQLTGENRTEAITNAVRERLESTRQKQKRKGVAERLMAIGRDFAAHADKRLMSIPHGDLLYDEKGLPK